MGRGNRKEPLFAVQRLHRLRNNDDVQSHDDNDYKTVNALHCNNYEVNGKKIVSKIPLTIFQNSFTRHFDIFLKEMMHNGQNGLILLDKCYD